MICGNRSSLASLALAFSACLSCTLAQGNEGVDERGGSESCACHTAVVRFLEAPTSTNFTLIPGTGNSKCWTSLRTKQLQALDRLVAGGNEPAAQLLAPHVRLLDGGELEDALRSLGQFAARHMLSLVKLSVSGALTDREFTDALTMLPLEFEDNFAAQIDELRARRLALEEITDPQMQGKRKAAIASINTFLAEVDRARAAYESQKH
jgi:hypothetical protein